MSAEDELEVLSESAVDLGNLREGRAGDVLLESTAQAVVPKKGRIFDDDGWCRISIIRPCQSRGARLRGLPPIYTPQMLEENAPVFNGALMYVDHLAESGLAESDIADLLAEARRSRKVDDMGGRVRIDPGKGWDPTFRGPDDDTFGYRPGSVMGMAKPVPRIREMVENDPELLHVSINAYPKSARKGVAPWDTSLVGMIVEGIRSTPTPSVDWVPRGGAGGRVAPAPVQEASRSTVSLGGHHYSQRGHDPSAPGRNHVPIDLSTLKTPEALREAVAAESPLLAEAAFGQTPAPVRDGMSRAEVQAAIQEAVNAERAANVTALEEMRESLDDDLDLQESARTRTTSFERRAAAAIGRANLPSTFEEGLLARYSTTEHGVGSGLLTEAADPRVAWSEVDTRLQADIADAQAIVEEVSGGAVVEGLGGSRQRARSERRTQGSFREFLSERSKDDVDDDAVKDFVMENVN